MRAVEPSSLPITSDLVKALQTHVRFDATRLELADEVATLQPLAAQAAERGRDIPGTSWLSRGPCNETRSG